MFAAVYNHRYWRRLAEVGRFCRYTLSFAEVKKVDRPRKIHTSQHPAEVAEVAEVDKTKWQTVTTRDFRKPLTAQKNFWRRLAEVCPPHTPLPSRDIGGGWDRPYTRRDTTENCRAAGGEKAYDQPSPEQP